MNAPVLFPRTVKSVLDATAKLSGFPVDVLIGEHRSADVVRWRQVCQFVLVRKCGFSGSSVARHMKRDHTTILSSIRRVERQIRLGDEKTLERIADIYALASDPRLWGADKPSRAAKSADGADADAAEQSDKALKAATSKNKTGKVEKFTPDWWRHNDEIFSAAFLASGEWPQPSEMFRARALSLSGYDSVQIAKIFRVSEATVVAWLDAARAKVTGGVNGKI